MRISASNAWQLPGVAGKEQRHRLTTCFPDANDVGEMLIAGLREFIDEYDIVFLHAAQWFLLGAVQQESSITSIVADIPIIEALRHAVGSPTGRHGYEHQCFPSHAGLNAAHNHR